MTHPCDSILIGVDAGGSKTTAWVINESDIESTSPLRPRGRGNAGSGNPRAVGFRAATEAIEVAIRNALQNAELPSQADASRSGSKLCLSVAGAGRDEEKQALREWARRKFPSAAVCVTDDAQPILAAASRNQIGVALISGTGSFAWGRSLDGNTLRCGGWGYLMGDEGSGYAVGVAALRAATQFADGRAEPTALLGALSEHFKIRHPSQLIKQVYDGPMSRSELARLSGLVFAVAESDQVARAIVDDAADSLAALVNTLATKLNLTGPSQTGNAATLALSGGLLIHQSKLREALFARVKNVFRITQVVPHPVAGALRLAAKL